MILCGAYMHRWEAKRREGNEVKIKSLYSIMRAECCTEMRCAVLLS